MKTVYFVRHGATEGNEQRAYQQLTTPLSKNGRVQAEVVARRFARIPIDIVIASDMERAAETARIIAEHNGLSVTYEPLFHEILRPTVVRGKGRDVPEVLDITRFLLENWTNSGVKHSDEENFFDLRERALKALEYLTMRPEENMLVVTHGTFLKMLISCMMAGKKTSSELFDWINSLLTTKNTGLTLCTYEKERWHLVTWNDHAHLG